MVTARMAGDGGAGRSKWPTPLKSLCRRSGPLGHAVDLQEPADGGCGAAGQGGDLGHGQVLMLAKVPEPGRAEDIGPGRGDGQGRV
jgi:hypothetical protein